MSSETPALKKRVIKPIIIRNNKKMLIKSSKLLANIKFPAKPVPQFKEEVIYASSNCDFLKGESQDVLIINRLNLLTKTCQTIAKCTSRGKSVETSSDSVCSVIGQKNYETVLSALSSVFNEETKVRGILALLSTQREYSSVATQTDMDMCEVKKNLVDMSCQTVDSRLNMFVKEKQRKRIRRQPLVPYVVTDKPAKLKKYIININDINDVKKDLHSELKQETSEKTPSLPDLKLVIDEDSNMSCGSIGNISLSSLPSVSGILDNPNSILSGIDKVTDKTLNSMGIPLRDGSIIMVPIKPEDIFHLATPDILKNVTHEERIKLIWHQAFIDFKMCLEQDEDGYYPLHIAVLSNDHDLVRRQCAALRARHESVDIPAGGLTALHMAVRQNESTTCTKRLLENGADPLLCDQERRCSLHVAAELESPQLRCLLNYCDTHARSVLKNNLDFWRPEHEAKTDEQLTRYLYRRVSAMFDDQGYTPLMWAAESAIPSNVSLLAARAGSLVDAQAPNCGATALYRAVAKACLHAKETGNTITTSDKILKTIEILVEHGADPSAENHSGSSVNTLLTEFNISALSMTIANKMTSMKHGKHFNENPNMILYKQNDGRIGYKDINNVTNTTSEMTLIRPIPPGLHAIITIEVPKTNESNNKKKSEEANNAKSNDDSNLSQSVKSKDGSLKAECSKIVKSNEMNNVASKRTKRISGVKNLILDNAILKAAIKDRNIILKELTANKCFVNAANSSVKDASLDENTNKKLGNVVLKHTNNNTNLNVSVKRNGLDNVSDGKNIALDGADAVKGFKVIKQLKCAKFFKNLNEKQIKAINITDLKQTNIDNAAISTDKNVNPKDSSPDKNVSIQVKGRNFIKADKNDNVKDDNVAGKSSAIADKTKDLQVSDMKTSNLNKTEVASSNEEPTRSAKERKTVVVVEDLALKKVFPVPNMLQAGISSVNARDILKSQKAISNKITNIPPKFIIKNNDIEIAHYRKRKLDSE